MLKPYLEDLESRINEQDEQALFEEWLRFTNGQFDGEIFTPHRHSPSPPSLPWPNPTVNEALDDFEAMVLQQLGPCSAQLAAAGGSLLNVRANYGTPIIPSLFGVKLYRMADALNTLPASWPLDGIEAIRAVVDGGVPNLHHSLGGQALEAGARYVELFRDYPKISRYVHIYHPDMQGPMDLCEMIWGSGIFMDSYEQPELLHELLEVITQTYSDYMHAWEMIVPHRADGLAVHWGMLTKGRLMLRDDSAMNFSPAMYREFFVPYEQRLLTEFGGGAMHFCGRGTHFVPIATTLKGLYAINLSQPECNNMEAIYQATVDRGTPLIGFSGPEAQRTLSAGRDLHSLVHVA